MMEKWESRPIKIINDEDSMRASSIELQLYDLTLQNPLLASCPGIKLPQNYFVFIKRLVQNFCHEQIIRKSIKIFSFNWSKCIFFLLPCAPTVK